MKSEDIKASIAKAFKDAYNRDVTVKFAASTAGSVVKIFGKPLALHTERIAP